jgi:hypothetical protein
LKIFKKLSETIIIVQLEAPRCTPTTFYSTWSWHERTRFGGTHCGVDTVRERNPTKRCYSPNLHFNTTFPGIRKTRQLCLI